TDTHEAKFSPGGWTVSEPWPTHAGGGSGACWISTSSRPRARTRSSRACRPAWSSCADSIVDADSTSTMTSANASRADGPSFPATLTSYVCPVTEASSSRSEACRDPDPSCIHEVKVERPDPLEEAMQAGLV